MPSTLIDALERFDRSDLILISSDFIRDSNRVSMENHASRKRFFESPESSQIVVSYPA